MSQRGRRDDRGREDLSRRDFIERSATAAALGLLLPACSGGDGPWDAGAEGGADGDTFPDSDQDIPLPDCFTDELPEDPYDDCRVVRVHDSRVSDFGFGDEEVCWQHIDGEVIRGMLDAAILELSRADTINEAWAALLPGDLSAARIAVKVNLNGDEHRFINNSPAMMIALAASLIEAGAVAENITMFDVSRGFPGPYRDAILAEVPGLALQGGGEVEQHETERVAAPSMVREDGTHISCPAPVRLLEADHFINLHVMKGHFGGATGAMKNLFGLARNVWNTFHGRGD